jgi:ABC-2 type transport system permease protein
MNNVIAFVLPGIMYFWVLFVGQGPMQEVIFDKEGNILPRILASPVTLPQFIMAKMLRCFIICTLAMILLIGFSRVVFGVMWGNPLLLAVAIAACGISMVGLLSAIYSLARTREQARTLSTTILLGMAMVGGGMFPFEKTSPCAAWPAANRSPT